MQKRGLFIVAIALVGALSVSLPSHASEPGSGTLDQDHTSVSWTGSTIAQTAGLSAGGCQLALHDPTCDTYALTIGEFAPPADPTVAPANDVRVAIAPGAGTLVEYDLYVYGPDGQEIARSVELGSTDMVTLYNPAPGTYTVAVQNVLSEPLATYSARADVVAATSAGPADPEQPCGLEGAPGGQPDDPTGTAPVVGDPTAAIAGTDTGERLSLDVLVLLDGVSETDARAIFSKAPRSYDPLNIDLRVAEYRPVTVVQPDNDATALIAQAKALVGGKRPAGIDVVELLTSKDIQQLGQTAIAGLADCIGGVAHDDRAFLVAEGLTPENLFIGPAVFDYDARANVSAHEIGHLMGGQHHYANCVEGIKTSDVHDDGAVEGSPCTLMFNAADFLGSEFDTLNGLIVRGSAVRYLK